MRILIKCMDGKEVWVRGTVQDDVVYVREVNKQSCAWEIK